MKLLKTAAPWIATAVTGPLGGIAIDLATSALGVSEKTTEGLKNALAGVTPEQMLALKKADQEFQAHMEELGIKKITDLEKIAADDRNSARDMQKSTRSNMPAILTCGVAAAFLAGFFVLFGVEIPKENKDIIVYMCGQLAAAFAACLAFWVGTTRNSNDKTEMLAKAQPIK
jgi:hypothetical protein